MLAFYSMRLRAAAEALMRGAGLLFSVTAFVATLIIAFNQKIAQAVSNWHGFSGWWAFVVPGLLVLYAIAHGHYERTTERERALERLEQRVGAIEARPLAVLAGQTGIANYGESNIIEGNVTQFGASAISGEPALSLDELAARSRDLSERMLVWWVDQAGPPLVSTPGEGFMEQYEANRAREAELETLARPEFGAEREFLSREAQSRGLAHVWDLDSRVGATRFPDVAERFGALARRIEAQQGPEPPALEPGEQ